MNDDFLIIILFIILGKNNNNKVFGINTMELDNEHTVNKMKILKEIGPYLPESYLPLLNRSIFFAEKFLKINEVSSLLQKGEEVYISSHVPMKNEERMKKIMSIIHKESINFKKGQMSQIVDLILNMDKYKKMFGVLNKLMSNPDNLNDPSGLVNLIGPLMGSGSEDNSSKIKEMSKMMELMKLLDSPKKEANQK